MKRNLPRLLTVGRLAEILGVAQHRVEYIISTRPHIRPCATAGRTRLFDRAAEAAIRYELNLIDALRTSGEEASS